MIPYYTDTYPTWHLSTFFLFSFFYAVYRKKAWDWKLFESLVFLRNINLCLTRYVPLLLAPRLLLFPSLIDKHFSSSVIVRIIFSCYNFWYLFPSEHSQDTPSFKGENFLFVKQSRNVSSSKKLSTTKQVHTSCKNWEAEKIRRSEIKMKSHVTYSDSRKR